MKLQNDKIQFEEERDFVKKLTKIGLISSLVVVIAASVWLIGYHSKKSVDAVFQARILEINEGSYLVEPVEGSQELKSSDQITVPITHLDSSLEPEVGDVIEIIYSGEIMETYPARLQNVSGIRIVSETKEEQWDLIPMVMVDGELYLDTGMNSDADGRCGVMDGEITSSVEGTQKPTQDGESNFGTGYGYQYGFQEGTIEIYMNEKWRVFATEEVRQEIQFPEKSID